MQSKSETKVSAMTVLAARAAQWLRSLGEVINRCVTILFSLFVFALVISLASCGAGSSSPPPPPLQPLTITSSAPPAGTTNVSYPGFTFTVASGGQAPFVWSETGSLPTGMTLSSGGLLSGTPTSAGSHSIMVTVKDSSSPQKTASQGFTIVINNPQPSGLAITSGAPPNGTVGAVYNRGNGVTCAPVGNVCHVCFLAASDRICPPDWRYENSFFFRATGGLPPYTWTWAPAPSSSLPLGLTLFSNGSFRGTPTAARTYNVVVTVTDSGSPAGQVSANYSIVISPPPSPTIRTTPAPSSGAVNLPYSFTFSVASGGQAPFNWTEPSMLPPGLMFKNDGVLSGTPTALGSSPITVVVQDSVGQNSAPQDFTIQIYSHGFKVIDSMGTARTAHTATLFSNGKVLVVGGFSSTGGLATAELFDPNSGSFSPTGSMQNGRFGHTATVLSPLFANGDKVLMTGGDTATAELFDDSTGIFTPTGSMETVRTFQTATLLEDGKVLVTGGRDSEDNPVASAELFDPTSGTFTPAGSMSAARYGHTASLLNDGKVLITGGTGATGQSIATAELFDPAKGSFTPTGSMGTARYTHTATLLTNGKVLVTGGFDSKFTALATAELFDPASGSFAPTGSMGTARAFQTATMLNDGTVLIAGGQDADRNLLTAAELFDSASGKFTPTGSMGTARYTHRATLLTNGKVIVTGGVDASGIALSTVELYR